MQKAFKLKLEWKTKDDVAHFRKWVLCEKKDETGKI